MPVVLVLYHSQEYGNTHAMAEAVAEGARQGGAEATLVNTNEVRMDIGSYRKADAVAFGSPDYYGYVAGGMKVFLDDWYIERKSDATGLTEKTYGLFYSHGGGGKVRGPLETLFKRMGTKVGPTVGSRGHPDERVLTACRDLGRELAEAAGR